jgi:hypothetical protein
MVRFDARPSNAGVRRARSAAPDGVVRLDARLAELVRGESRTRLMLGELLELLARRNGHHELGFSSLGAYARERSGRSARWANESRLLAERVAKLPQLRAALSGGALGWCMAELVARHATPNTDAGLTELALGSTVREMRALLVGSGQMSAADVALWSDRVHSGDLERVTLGVTLGAADAWLWQWTRRFAEHAFGEHTTEGFVHALLSESFSSLSHVLPANDLEVFDRSEREADAQARWRQQLGAWREESEKRCEKNFTERGPGGESAAAVFELPGSLHALDARIGQLSRELGQREVELGRAARAFHEAEGWRRLGYASESQYVRERLGISPSSFKAKLALARRWCARVRGALGAGEIGYEAALLISRVATAETAEAWIERARARTAKHLEEDVRAAELSRDIGGRVTPPSEETLREIRRLESRVLSGDRDAVLEAQGQMSARLGAGAAGVRMDLRVARDTARFWRTLAGVMHKHLPRGTSFARLLCDTFWEAWRHLGERSEKYAHIYARDRYTCSSPVCSRHDVTPHHVRFRSHGGSDDDDNVIALCTWCHLEGVHGGRLAVTGTAGDLEWELGRRQPSRAFAVRRARVPAAARVARLAPVSARAARSGARRPERGPPRWCRQA